MSELESAHTPPPSAPVSSSQDRARKARESLIGKSIAGRYVLRSLLGHGGMGAVYEAEHLGIGKRVAIKFVDPEFVTDEQVVTRFAREARAMSAIESAHIVTIFDAGTEDGRPYLVMELLRGEDLGQRLRRTTRVPLAESLHIIAMVLKGLGKAHAEGIVHRDLKPDNVFLVKNDDGAAHAKIVDFGVSKIERPRNRTSPLALTGRGTVLGTPFYMSPEQAQAMPDLDGRADLFSVGTILFECLAGRPPHTGETYEQIILSICMRDAPDLRVVNPEVPANVAAYVAKALARERTQRFSSADEMLAALHELSPEEKKLVPRDPPASKTLAIGGSVATPPGVAAFHGNATQIAGSGPASVVAAPAKGSTVVSPHTPGTVALPPSAAAPRTSSRPSFAAAGLPERRSTSAVIATAAIATLLGVGATLALVSAFTKKDERRVNPPSITSGVPATATAKGASTIALVPIPSDTVAPAASPLVSAAPRPPSPPVIANSGKPPSPGPAAPKPSAPSKSLDIARDLP